MRGDEDCEPGAEFADSLGAGGGVFFCVFYNHCDGLDLLSLTELGFTKSSRSILMMSWTETGAFWKEMVGCSIKKRYQGLRMMKVNQLDTIFAVDINITPVHRRKRM